MKSSGFLSFQEFKERYQKVEFQEYFNELPSEVSVSICVITYQHSQYIRQCLDSILEQETSFKYEILVGDDGSTDRTREICKEYADRYPDKIKLFLHSRENNISLYGKPSGRFNFLYNIFSSRGKYIALCEGDDFWTDPLKLQEQYDAMEANQDCSVCFTAANFLDESDSENSYLYRPKGFSKKSKFTISEAIRDSGGFMPTASIFFRKELIQKIPLWMINSPVGDLPLTLLLGLKGNYLYLDEPMITYRLDTPMSWSVNQKDFVYRRKVVRGICQTLWEFNKYSGYKYVGIVFGEIMRRQFDLLKMFLKKGSKK